MTTPFLKGCDILPLSICCILRVNFIYSEKATIFCKISTVNLSLVVTVKSTVEISQNFVTFSGYMNFNSKFGPSMNSEYPSWKGLTVHKHGNQRPLKSKHHILWSLKTDKFKSKELFTTEMSGVHDYKNFTLNFPLLQEIESENKSLVNKQKISKFAWRYHE